MMKNRGYLPALLAGLITLVVFLPAVNNGYINWDDPPYVLKNDHIARIDIELFRWAFFSFYAGFWIPLTWISFAIDRAIWGLNPFGFHLTNVLLHAVNASLVSLLALQMIKASRGKEAAAGNDPQKLSDGMMETFALLTGILFGVHPLRVESVAWITERKDVLSGMFGMFSLIFYISYTKKRAGFSAGPMQSLKDKRYLAALILFFLSIISKPMIVMLPVVFLIIEWFPLGRLADRKGLIAAVTEKIPFFIISATIGIITVFASSPVMPDFKTLPLLPRILIACKSIMAYIKFMLWPAGVVAIYDHPGSAVSILKAEYLIPVIMVIFITVITLLAVRWQKILSAVWLYFIVTLFPVLGISQVGPQAMADRFTYFPSIGPAMLAASGVIIGYRKLNGKRILRYGLTGAVCVLLVYYTALTSRLIHAWRDTETIWTYAIEKQPEKAGTAYLQRGSFYGDNGKYELALKDVDTAMMIFERDRNERMISRAYAFRGKIYLDWGKYREAIDNYTQAVELNTGRPEKDYYLNRGEAFRALGMNEEAKKDFAIAERIKGPE